MKTSTIIFIISIMTLAIFLGACTQQNIQPDQDQIYCTQEAKLCPDGSYVGRNASNDCAFDPCPTVDETEDDPDVIGVFDCKGKRYTAYTQGYCARATFPTGTSCIITDNGDIVAPGNEEADVRECLDNSYFCDGKYYMIENVKCEVLDPQPGHTCIDIDNGALIVPSEEQTRVQDCLRKGGNTQ